MTSLRKSPDGVKPSSLSPTPTQPDSSRRSLIDEREQLCNEGQRGSIQQVALPLELITSLRGILLDLDPSHFHERWVPATLLNAPTQFYRQLGL